MSRTPFWSGALRETAISIAVGGIGPRAAAVGASLLADEAGASWLVSAGVSGALWDGLRVGDVLQARVVLDGQGGEWRAAPLLSTGQWFEKHLQTPDIADAVEFSSGAVLTSADAKRQAHDTHGADAVDMESAAIAAVAAERGLRFSCVRAISDAADQELPMDFNRFVCNTGRVRLAALLLHLSLRPWLAPSLVRLSRDIASASDALAEIVVQAIALAPGPYARVANALPRE